MPEIDATDQFGRKIKGMIPFAILPDSWLRDPKFAWFVQSYEYACTQSKACLALSTCEPEALYSAFTALMRGACRNKVLRKAIESAGSMNGTIEDMIKEE